MVEQATGYQTGLTTERLLQLLPRGPFPDCDDLVKASLGGSADNLNALMVLAYLRGKQHGRDEARQETQLNIRHALMLDGG